MTQPPYEASVYLVLERQRYGMSIVEMRKNKPSMRAGQVAVRVKLLMDAKAFEQLIPTITAELQLADMIEPTIEITPPDPVD